MKRLLSLLLTLVLLPAAAYAEESTPRRVETALTFSNADLLPEGIRRFLTEGFLWTSYEQEDAHGFSITLDGEEALRIDRVDADGTHYLYTNLSDGTLALEADAFAPTAVKVVQTLGDMGVIPAELAQTFATLMQDDDEAPALDVFDPAALDWTALTALEEMISQTPVVTQTPGQEIGYPFDAYDYVETLTFTPDQVITAVDALLSFLTSNYSELSKLEHVSACLPMAYMKLVGFRLDLIMSKLMRDDLTVSIYRADSSAEAFANPDSALFFLEPVNNDDIVAVDVRTTTKEDGDVQLLYLRLTEEGMTSHALVSLAGGEEQSSAHLSLGETVQVYTAAWTNGEGQHSVIAVHEVLDTEDGSFAEEYRCTYFLHQDGEAATHKQALIHIAGQEPDVTCQVLLAENDQTVLEAEIVRTWTPAVPAIVPEDAVRIDLLDGEGLSAWLERFITDARAWWDRSQDMLPEEIREIFPADAQPDEKTVNEPEI